MIFELAVPDTFFVTLHVSVWVEIDVPLVLRPWELVTLHVSVWVEIFCDALFADDSASHAPRERVSWNSAMDKQCTAAYSHAPRERVSWNCWYCKHAVPKSDVTLHVSVWVEMLELSLKQYIIWRHAPRERVSWNCPRVVNYQHTIVTLHVSVWVEIGRYQRQCKLHNVTLHVSVWVEMACLPWHFSIFSVTLHVSVWVEITMITTKVVGWLSHAPRERVSWNYHSQTW